MLEKYSGRDIEAPWYSSHGLWLLHKRSQFDSHSRWFTCQVNEPLPGSAHALWGKLGAADRTLAYIMSVIAKMGFSASCILSHIEISSFVVINIALLVLRTLKNLHYIRLLTTWRQKNICWALRFQYNK